MMSMVDDKGNIYQIPSREELDRSHKENFAKLDSAKREEAISVLVREISDHDWEKIGQEKARQPLDWWVRYHFNFGMWVRNTLRRNGLGEKQMGVENLDDVWVPILEEALERHATP